MFRVLEFYNDKVPRSAPINMALDEVLWASATRPAFRVYRWDHMALSFGYFGRYADVAHYKNDRELVRRCTGGGVVFHGSDLTYSLVIPASEGIYRESSVAIYAFVHEAIKAALETAGIEATLVRPDASSLSMSDFTGPCFVRPVAADVLIQEQKVAGAAQRRSRGGLLQQGSIQNVELPVDFCEKFALRLSSDVTPSVIRPDILEKARQLSESKYATENWLKRR